MNSTISGRRAAVFGAALWVAFAAGCGGKAPLTAPPPNVQDALQDLGDLLKLLGEQKQKLPARQADLDLYEPTAPHAAAAVQSQQITYFWGNGITPGGKAVIAHDAKAAADGGAVLLQDGTVKTLSAAEFAAAPKAAKK